MASNVDPVTDFPTESFEDDFLFGVTDEPKLFEDDFFTDDDESNLNGDRLPVPTTVIPEMMVPTGVPPVPTPVAVAPIPIPPVSVQQPRVPTETPTIFTSSPTSTDFDLGDTFSPTSLAEMTWEPTSTAEGGYTSSPTSDGFVLRDTSEPTTIAQKWSDSFNNPYPVSTPPFFAPHEQAHPSGTYYPTWSPTEPQPTHRPTATYPPTFMPTATYFPTKAPTKEVQPTLTPTQKPFTFPPTEQDIEDRPEPTETPTTKTPTNEPTAKPSLPPTNKPTPTPKQTGNAGLKGDFSRNKFVGFQSNWGPAHPGSMTYDFTRNSIYVTGTTIPKTSAPFQRSTCFAGALPIADIELWKVVDDPLPPRALEGFTVPDSLNEKEIMGCHLVYHDDENNKNEVMFVGGVDEEDATERSGSIKPFLNYYKRSRNSPDWRLAGQATEYNLIDAKFQTQLVEAAVKYPIAMASGSLGRNEDRMMVVFVGSDDKLLTEAYIENGDATNPNNKKNTLLPPGVGMADPSQYSVPKRGSNFFMSINEYMFNEKGELQHSYGQDLRHADKDKGETYPTAVVNKDSKGREYLFAGHVRGYTALGFNAPQPQDANGNMHFDDLDGFVSMIKFPQTRPSWIREANQRFSSIEMNPHLDDMVHGMCLGPLQDNDKANEYYVVGSTYGTMPPEGEQTEITTNILSGGSPNNNDGDTIAKLSSWITKIDLTTNNRIWTTQLYATSNMFDLYGGKNEAFGCHVIDSDSSRMYVAGTVYSGGIMNSSEKSAGSDDVWVAQLSTDDGSIRWIRQIGSSGRDRLARTNGIEADLNGHAIIYGETTGELYRTRSGETIHKRDGSSTDIFITTLDIESGMSESTIESDRNFSQVRKVSIGFFLVFFAVLMLCFCICFRRNRTAKKVASRGEVDGVLSDPNVAAFKDEVETGEFENGYTDSATNGGYDDSTTNGPPSEAFQDDGKVV